MSSTTFLLPSVIVFLVITLLVAISYVVPRLTRPDLYFAVTVPPDFRDSSLGRAILGRYRFELVIYGLIAMSVALSGFWIHQPSGSVVIVAGLILQVAGAFTAYYRARRKVLPHAVEPATIREAALEPHEVRLPGGWTVQAGPFALLAAVAFWLKLHWSEIPERFPVHWGMDGRPNNWASRSFIGVFSPLLTGAFFSALIGFLAYATLRWSRVIRMGGRAGESEQRFRRMVVSILIATEYFLAVVFGWTGLLPLSSAQTVPPAVVPILLLSLGFSIVVTLLLMSVGQGGSRLAGGAASTTVVPVGDRTADRYWKLGLFYVNHDDPAVIVEKRFGIGYTINFGHTSAWLVIGGLLAIAIVTIVLVSHHH